MGGEKYLPCFNADGFVGSPPRWRGKAVKFRCTCGLQRITPAWAGKRFVTYNCGCGNKDHPRVGGEKTWRTTKAWRSGGSPPRGRGKAIRLVVLWLAGRITPAWAGKRLKRSHRSGIFISGPIPFHSVLHRPAGSGGSRAGRDGSPAGQPQNTGPA